MKTGNISRAHHLGRNLHPVFLDIQAARSATHPETRKQI